MRKILERIREIIGADNLMADHGDRLVYAKSACFEPSSGALPLAVARPRHFSALSNLLAFCSQKKIPLVFRGGGSWPGNHAAPIDPDTLVILSTGLAKINEPEIPDYSMPVQPGTKCAEVAAKAAAHGLFFPPMPVDPGISTIGGLLAVNDAGPAYAKYGPPSSWLQSLEIVTTSGRAIELAAARDLPQNMAGRLPLAQLFCGSMGDYAFLGQCRLRLLPLPRFNASFLLHFASGQEAARAAALCFEPRFGIPAALEIFDPAASATLMGDPNWRSWLLFCALHYEDREQGARLAGDLLDLLGKHARLEIEAFSRLRAGLWAALAGRLGQFHLERLASPPQAFCRFLESVMAVMTKYDLQTAIVANPAIARIDVAIFGDGASRASLMRELFALELMINERMRSEEDADLERRAWREREKQADPMLSALADLLDPAGLLAARRGARL